MKASKPLVAPYRIRARSAAGGFTLLEVVVAIAVMTIAMFPLLDSVKHSRQAVKSAEIMRTMKQLLEYKMAQILLDQPPEGEEPIYVDGAEGNFGEDFAADKDKAYWFEDKYYHYSYRIDSEEVDLGSGGGITGEEEEQTAAERERERQAQDAAASPLGALGGAAEEEEDLGQLRYRVTLSIFHHNNLSKLNRTMSAVVYVKHPRAKETMTGPEGAGGAPGGQGGTGGMLGGMTQTTGSGGQMGIFGGSGAGGGRGGSITTIGGARGPTGDQPKAGGLRRR